MGKLWLSKDKVYEMAHEILRTLHEPEQGRGVGLYLGCASTANAFLTFRQALSWRIDDFGLELTRTSLPECRKRIPVGVSLKYGY